jgi:serine/threonine protein kinase
MALSAKRWNEITPSQFLWERDALDYLRNGLPDHDPYFAWSNFEFISDDGTINEVDLLVLTPQGFFLVEIKSSPGTLSGDATNWVWTHEGRARTDDNPLFLANRKAKKLASLLKRQKAWSKARLPYLEPLIFCSHPELKCHLQGIARNRVCLRDRVGNPDKPAKGILSALKNRDFDGANENARPHIDRPVMRAIAIAMEQAGIRPSQRSRRVGDYILGELLYESPTGAYQDWEAKHSTIETSKRRVRIYNIARNTSADDHEAIKRAAQREYKILDSISHTGILPVESFTEHELGPALIFRHDPTAQRLDHYLSQNHDSLNVDTRLSLLRQIAEALRYAHEKRIVHRALSPQSILVTEPGSTLPRIKIFNWQMGYRDSSSATRTGAHHSATAHPENFFEDISAVYLAPEAVAETDSLGEHLDIFSLGAIAYHIFTGKPPAATSLEMAQLVRDAKGLQISAVLDGAGKEMQELIQFSTHPEVLNRYESLSDFLAQLDSVEEELTRPDEEGIKSVTDAVAGDYLPGGFKVKNRLGTGSSAIALLVERDGKEVVLKIATSPDYNDRLRAEAETIRKLRHPNIVEAYEDVEINGQVGFTMQKAGELSLGKRLRAEGRLSLDFLERFGEDLLDAVRYLEDVGGVQHRDIKPDNIGVRAMGRDNKERLVLFDFSLSQTPVDNIRAGTEPYLDPFLMLRKPPRWDLHAERFAAAMTLYQMATGTLPKWGDGQSNPAMLDCEATLNAEFFDPNLREAMLDFFEKALRRDYQQRFDNTGEMLRAWRHIFEAIDQPAAGTEVDFDITAAISNATLTTQVITLGLSTRAANALDRLNVITVRDLLLVPLNEIYKLRGVGHKTRREIAALAGELRPHFPDVQHPQPTTESVTDSEGAEPEVASVDLIAEQVARFGSRERGQSERNILHSFIGWDAVGKFSVFDVYEWPSQADVARYLGSSRAYVGQIVTKARARWLKNTSLKGLRKTIAEIIEASGGAMTSRELMAAILAARGSSADEPRRSQLASVITRAAVETESSTDSPRFIQRRSGSTIIIARDAVVADYVERLSRAADRLAELDTVPTPARTIETLRAVAAPDGIGVINDSRLVQLAVAASTKAAVSSRLEIYPKAMPAVKALKLAHGALTGARELSVEEIRQRVASRYPEAVALPDRPALDALLAEVELDLRWSAETSTYRYSTRDSESRLSSSTHHVRFPTQLAAAATARAVEVPSEIADARVFENKLRRANNEGAFLALTVAPPGFLNAEKELVHRFDLERRSIDEMLIRAMREQTQAANADWNLVLRADAAGPEGQDWRKLLFLIGRSIPIIEQQLNESQKTVLLVQSGLLARYNRLDLIERLRDRVGTSASRLHGLWLLLPADEQSVLPTLNGKPVPVIGPGQWARIPEAWIDNRHRAMG